jgi:hypothetical protein
MAVATRAFITLYFVGLKKPDHMPASPGHWETLRTALQFLSVSVGCGGSSWWPQKAAFVCVVLLSSCVLLLIAWWKRPGHRFRITGLLFLTATIFPLALSLGWGRAYNGIHAGLSHWYTIFGVPALCAAYFAWRLYAPSPLSRLVRTCLFAAACMMLSLNVDWSKHDFSEHQKRMNAFMGDLRSGMLLPELADRHVQFLLGDHASIFWAPSVKKLHDAGYPVFRALNAPRMSEVPVEFSLLRANDATWADGVLSTHGNDPFVVFSLAQPRFVSAIELIFAYADTPGPAEVEFRWKTRSDADFAGTNRYLRWLQDTTLPVCSRTVVINDAVDQFRIDPAAGPCSFHLRSVRFLVIDDVNSRP